MLPFPLPLSVVSGGVVVVGDLNCFALLCVALCPPLPHHRSGLVLFNVFPFQYHSDNIGFGYDQDIEKVREISCSVSLRHPGK